MSTGMSDMESLLRVEQLSSELVCHVYIYVRPGDPYKIVGVLREKSAELVEIGLEEHDVESWWTIPSRRQMDS